MAYNLVTRAQWGAVPPTRTVPLNWNIVDKFIVHYSGASRSQTVRSIQRFCMESKGHSDIDYNDLVRDRDRYIGRGVNVGSHTLGNNSTSYGVCVIGVDGDANDDDLRTVREIYDEVCGKLGRQLRKLGHRTAMPPGYTSCPGDELQAWVDRGMPYPNLTAGDADMNFNQAQELDAVFNLYETVKLDTDGNPDGSGSLVDFPVPLTAFLRKLAADVAALDGSAEGGISEDRLRQVIREEIARTRLS